MEWYGLLQDAMEELDEKLTGFRDDIIREIRKTEPTPPEPEPGPGPAPTPTPTPTPTPIPTGKISTGQSLHNFDPYMCRIWELLPSRYEKTLYLAVSNTSQSMQPRTVHLLVAKNRRPTLDDFERTYGRAPSYYDRRLKVWLPSKKGVEDLYWRYNTGSQAEFIQIKDLVINGDKYYIMLYNYGEKSVRSQRLIISVF